MGLTFERKADFVPPPGAPPDAANEMEMDYTIEELADAIDAAGHDCVLLGNAQRLLPLVANLRGRIDLVFNYSVGYGGRARETWIPALLDVAGIPYVGGDAVCLGIASDKAATKALAATLGVRTPQGALVAPGEPLPALPAFPLMCKPAFEGSSIGIGEDARVADRDALERLLARLFATYRQPVVVESFVAGREATVTLVGDPLVAHGVVGVAIDGEGDLGERFLSNGLKGSPMRTAGLVPSGLPAHVEDEMKRASERVSRALGARDYCRCDWRIDAEGTPFLLEVNPIPQLQRIKGEFSLVEEAQGGTFHGVVARILESAIRRNGLKG